MDSLTCWASVLADFAFTILMCRKTAGDDDGDEDRSDEINLDVMSSHHLISGPCPPGERRLKLTPCYGVVESKLAK